MAKRTRRSLDTALESVIGHLPEKPREQKKNEKAKDEIISRRDERGTPYPGDFPNPASDRTRGCF
ncbi:MAG TPA: hypothetical protein VH080_05485 [Gemmatimonadaceae bacterium]|jgi:hypothetical protein|nr:hypothetical protein [Gemmatimonadaceae bacterium]